jgi:hypothetical protein
MKIGVLFTVYNCEKYLEKCLSPWFELKNRYNFIFATNSGMFSDYLTLGIPYRNKETLEILKEYDLDFLITTKGNNLLGEDESRNMCLEFLNGRGCDLIWVLDGDEVYTKNQIINIMEFIHKNPTFDHYSVNFKNLTIKEHLFLDYPHERIFWTNRYGGIKHFYFDNRFQYNDGTDFFSALGVEIPKSVAYIKHNSWLSDDIRTKDKIIYQKFRYCGPNGDLPIECRCTYEWDTINDRLKFSESFHSCNGVEIPILKEELSIYSLDFTLSFSRKNNCFYVSKVERNVDSFFEIYNDDDMSLIYSTKLPILRDINYYMSPSTSYGNFNDNENFYAFNIKVYEFGKLIHNEKLHLRLKS